MKKLQIAASTLPPDPCPAMGRPQSMMVLAEVMTAILAAVEERMKSGLLVRVMQLP